MISKFVQHRSDLNQLEQQLPRPYEDVEKLKELTIENEVFKLQEFVPTLSRYIEKRRKFLTDTNKQTNEEECSKSVHTAMLAEYKKKYNAEEDYEKKLENTSDVLDDLRKFLSNLVIPKLESPRGLDQMCWKKSKNSMVGLFRFIDQPQRYYM